jgi:hypothetical protein
VENKLTAKSTNSRERSVNQLIESLSVKKPKHESEPVCPLEKEVEVLVDNKYYGNCPKCGEQFDYEKVDVGRLLRRRFCGCPMRLEWALET